MLMLLQPLYHTQLAACRRILNITKNEWIFNHTKADCPAVIRLTVSGVRAMEQLHAHNLDMDSRWLRCAGPPPLHLAWWMMPGTQARLMAFDDLHCCYCAHTTNTSYLHNHYRVHLTKRWFPLACLHWNSLHSRAGIVWVSCLLSVHCLEAAVKAMCSKA